MTRQKFVEGYDGVGMEYIEQRVPKIVVRERSSSEKVSLNTLVNFKLEVLCGEMFLSMMTMSINSEFEFEMLRIADGHEVILETTTDIINSVDGRMYEKRNAYIAKLEKYFVNLTEGGDIAEKEIKFKVRVIGSDIKLK